MTKRPSRKATKAPRAAEYRFKIDAFTPETLPMARLAEYMAEIATILGEPRSVHFVRLEGGSTTLVHRIEHEAVPKVVERTQRIRYGDGPRDGQTAYRKINRFLREDNASAVLRKGKSGARILEFPGTAEAEQEFPSVNQFGSVTGTLIRIGGSTDTVYVLMESEGVQIPHCHTNRHLAKNLAQYLFETVRLHGQGYWMRDDEGVWSLKHFRIDSFETLSNDTLSAALTELRAVAGEWDRGTLKDLRAIRGGGANGRD